MGEYLPAIVFGTIVAAIVLVFLIVWFATRRMSTLPKMLIRLAVAVVLLAAPALLVLQPSALQQLGGGMADRAVAPETDRAAREATPPDSARPPEKSARREGGSGASPNESNESRSLAPTEQRRQERQRAGHHHGDTDRRSDGDP